MSYFATISGVDLSQRQVPGVTFVPAQSAQEYLSRLVPKIAALDGAPVYFCDDGTTGTSSDFVGEAVDVAFERNSLDGTGMLALLELCECTKSVLRLWWAGNSSNAFAQVPSCTNLAEAVPLLVSQAHRKLWGIRFAP